MNLHLSLTALAVLALTVPTAQAEEAKIRAARQTEGSTPWQVTFHGGAGVGVFQDIQVPGNYLASQRGDGTVLQEENNNHTGLPLYAGIGLNRRVIGQLTWETLGLDAMQMRASTGPAETQSSSYSRLDLGTGLKYGIALGNNVVSIGARASARRTAWSNVSAGHFLNAGLVGGSFGLMGGDGYGLELFGNVAPVAHFGYSDATLFGGNQFKQSSASMSEAGARISIPLKQNVWVDTGFERESTHVVIRDISEYNGMGLSVLDPANPTRTYDLTTTVVRFGFRKMF